MRLCVVLIKGRGSVIQEMALSSKREFYSWLGMPQLSAELRKSRGPSALLAIPRSGELVQFDFSRLTSGTLDEVLGTLRALRTPECCRT